MSKYLDEVGLDLLWGKINNKFAAKATTLAGYNITDGVNAVTANNNLTGSVSGHGLTIGVASGYSIPSTANQANWTTAYNFVNTITQADTDKTINKWSEIVDFLAGLNGETTLENLLNGLKGDITSAIEALDSSSADVTADYALTKITITDGKITARSQTDTIAKAKKLVTSAGADYSAGSSVRPVYFTGGVPTQISTWGDTSTRLAAYFSTLDASGNATIGGTLGVTGLATFNATNGIQIGNVKITYDSANGGLRFEGGGIYSTSYVSAFGANDDENEGDSLSGLIDVQLNGLATNDVLRYNGTHWVNVPQSSIAPTLQTLTLEEGAFSATSYNPSTAKTVKIPTKTSHLTNDSGFMAQSDIDAIIAELHSEIDSVASRDSFLEVVAEHISVGTLAADYITANTIEGSFVGDLTGNAATATNASQLGGTAKGDLLTSITASGGSIGVTVGGTTKTATAGGTWAIGISGNAATASRLGGDTTYAAWGQTYWQNGVPKTISGNMTGVGSITASGDITTTASIGIGTTSPAYKLDVNGDIRTQGKKLYFGTNTDAYIELDSDGYFHFSKGLYSESFVTAFGVGSDSASGGGLDSVAMWAELGTTVEVKVIDLSHIPTIPTSKISGLVQVDWNVTDSASYAYIKNKPTSLKNPNSITFTRDAMTASSSDLVATPVTAASITYDGSAAATISIGNLIQALSNDDIDKICA